jgi:hypothetical protein
MEPRGHEKIVCRPGRPEPLGAGNRWSWSFAYPGGDLTSLASSIRVCLGGEKL